MGCRGGGRGDGARDDRSEGWLHLRGAIQRIRVAFFALLGVGVLARRTGPPLCPSPSPLVTASIAFAWLIKGVALRSMSIPIALTALFSTGLAPRILIARRLISPGISTVLGERRAGADRERIR